METTTIRYPLQHTGEGLGLGSAGFVERHNLYSDVQTEAAVEVGARIEELGLRTVRLVLVDQHGVPRSKHLSGGGAATSNCSPASARSSPPDTHAVFKPSSSLSTTAATS